jgi:hypothetical protein
MKKGERNSLALCAFFLRTVLGFRLLSPQIINGHKPHKHHEDDHAPLGERGDGDGGGHGDRHRVGLQARAVIHARVRGRDRESKRAGRGRRSRDEAAARER